MNKNTLFAKRLPLFLQISWKPPRAPADMALAATLHVHGPQPPHKPLFPFVRALSFDMPAILPGTIPLS